MEQPGTLKPQGPAPQDGGAIAALSLRVADWRDFGAKQDIAAWDRLSQTVAVPNPFYESWFLCPSLQALDAMGEVKLILLETGGELVGLMPIVRQSYYYGHRLPHWRNWVHANCFNGQPLVMSGFEPAFWNTLLTWLDEQSGLPLFFHLAQSPTQGALHTALEEELIQQSRSCATVVREQRAMLESDLSGEDYLAASLSQKKRKELRRQHRRFGEEGELSFERLEAGGMNDSSVAVWTEEFLTLEARGWKGKAGSALASDPQTAALFTASLAGAAANNRLQLLSLRLDGRPVAMLANFLCPPGAYSFKTAFDEDFSRFSPGVLLQQENLAILGNRDIAWVDSCASQDHPMIDHLWRERREIACHSIAIGGPLRRAAFNLLSLYENSTLPRGLS